MALQDTDLFVVQSQDDKQLYSVRLDVLKADIAAGAGVNFKGSADLNVAPADQGIASPDNGDLYMVESNANPITVEWVIQESPTSATKGDRIIYDGDNSNWILITSGSSNAGTITDITATLPLKSDNHPTSPVLSIRQARTEQGAIDDADGEGTAGAIAKLAVAADVAAGGSADATAVVTADLLEATNVAIDNINTTIGSLVTGVSEVSTTDANTNGALTISPETGDVVIEIATSSETGYGVVQIATAAEILSGEDGAEAVVDASHLKAVNDRLPDGTAEGQYLKWDNTNSKWDPTDTIDGGVYATS